MLPFSPSACAPRPARLLMGLGNSLVRPPMDDEGARDPERDRLTGRVARFAKVGAGLSGAAATFGANRLFGGGDIQGRNARALREALGQLKGPLMKVAQMFATVPDLL